MSSEWERNKGWLDNYLLYQFYSSHVTCFYTLAEQELISLGMSSNWKKKYFIDVGMVRMVKMGNISFSP